MIATSLSGNSTERRIPALPRILLNSLFAWIFVMATVSSVALAQGVPIDYAHVDGPQTTLGVTRLKALVESADARELVFNPGGPGAAPAKLWPSRHLAKATIFERDSRWFNHW